MDLLDKMEEMEEENKQPINKTKSKEQNQNDLFKKVKTLEKEKKKKKENSFSFSEELQIIERLIKKGKGYPKTEQSIMEKMKTLWEHKFKTKLEIPKSTEKRYQFFREKLNLLKEEKI